MTRKVEGGSDIAVAREGEREGLHQRAGAGKTVRDHDDRPERSRRGAIDRRGRAAKAFRLYRHAGVLSVQSDHGEADGERGQRRHEEVHQAAAQFEFASVNSRSGRHITVGGEAPAAPERGAKRTAAKLRKGCV